MSKEICFTIKEVGKTFREEFLKKYPNGFDEKFSEEFLEKYPDGCLEGIDYPFTQTDVLSGIVKKATRQINHEMLKELSILTKDSRVLEKLSKINDDEIIINVMMNLYTTDDILISIINNDDIKYDIKYTTIFKFRPIKGKVSERVIREFYKKYKDHSIIIKQIAESKLIPDDCLREIVDIYVVNETYDNLDDESKEKKEYMRNRLIIAILKNCNTPADVIEKCSKYYIGVEMAYHKNTPVDIMHKIFAMNDSKMNCALAYNRSTPPDILSELAKKIDTNIWRELAENPNTLPEDLRKIYMLSKIFRKKYVIYELGNNPNTPEDIRQKISK